MMIRMTVPLIWRMSAAPRDISDLPPMPTGAKMRKTSAVAFLLAAACTQQSTTVPANDATPADNQTAVVENEAPLNPPAPGEPGGLPDDRTPISEGPIDRKSGQGAGQVVQQYFALAESGKF